MNKRTPHTPILQAVFTLVVAGPAYADAPEDPPSIRFDSLEIGQVSRYKAFIGQNYRSPNLSPFEYIGGVLVMEIVDQNSDGWVVKEFFESAPNVPEHLRTFLDPDTTFTYALRVEQDVLRVIAQGTELRSRLFFPRVRPDLPLRPFGEHETELMGWKTTLPYCECYREAFIEDAEVGGRTYPDVNAVVDNDFMQVDGPGATYLYSAEDGLVRSVWYSWWTGEGLGFDRIASSDE